MSLSGGASPYFSRFSLGASGRTFTSVTRGSGVGFWAKRPVGSIFVITLIAWGSWAGIRFLMAFIIGDGEIGDSSGAVWVGKVWSKGLALAVVVAWEPRILIAFNCSVISLTILPPTVLGRAGQVWKSVG